MVDERNHGELRLPNNVSTLIDDFVYATVVGAVNQSANFQGPPVLLDPLDLGSLPYLTLP